MMIIATLTMVSAVFASTKVKVHCEEGDIITYIYNLNELQVDHTTDDDITFDNYIENDIEYVLSKDGIMICIDRDFKQGTWASEAVGMVKDNSDIYVSANFVDAILLVFPYKGHVITISAPRE